MDPRYREREAALKRRFGSQRHGRCEEYVTRNWIWKFVRLSDRFRLRDLARKTVGFTSIPYLCDVART